MKKSILPLALVSLVAISQSCMEEIESNPQKIQVAFTLSSDRNIPSDLTSSRLVVRIESQSGEPVMEYQEVTFEFSENGFITEALDLPFGNYTITDFMLVDGNNDIIYAVPKASGTLSRSVSHPLNLDFSFFSSESRRDLTLTLVDVRNKKASDFGYSSFRRPGHRLTLIVVAGKDAKPVAANAFILNGKDTLNRYDIKAGANHIVIPALTMGDHKLAISKSGYASARYILADLIQNQEKKPIKVSLAPAFTMLAHIDFSSSPIFDFYLGGPEGTSIAIDWGDGSMEDYELNGDVNITHSYAEDGNHPVTITGDIGKINYFYSFYGQAMVDAIDFQHLAGLREIRFGLTRGPVTIDLTNNASLEHVMLTGLPDMKSLLLAEQHKIRSLLIEGPNLLNSAAVDAVIASLYRNAVKQNIMNGTFSMPADWASGETDETLVGPPSSEGMTQLRSLKENYGWIIYPDPFD